jgi:hypothetical protein
MRGYDLMTDIRQRASTWGPTTLVTWTTEVAFPTLCAAPNLQRLEIEITNLGVTGLFVSLYEQDWKSFNKRLMLKECASLKEVLFVLHLPNHGAGASQLEVDSAIQILFAGAIEAGIRVHAECHFA